MEQSIRIRRLLFKCRGSHIEAPVQTPAKPEHEQKASAAEAVDEEHPGCWTDPALLILLVH